MKTADFDFLLPPGFIAERPVDNRADSRLLVLHRDGGMEHKRFSDLLSYLHAGDMLLLNNSRVFPASFTGSKPTGGKIEFLLVSRLSDRSWNVLSRSSYTGELTIAERFPISMTGGKAITFGANQNIREIIWKYGRMPLPPYIRRMSDEADKERYQTVYAEKEGSIAAPTAGLHFTGELLDALRERSVLVRSVTLHVGIGTFRPVKSETIEDHRMDEENFEIRPAVIHDIEKVKKQGGRIIAVGTTATRTIEGYLSGRSRVLSDNGRITGSTDIFIHEGYHFRAVDVLITNFHLPRSTPLMLAAAFAGRKNLFNAYKEAISRGYRFFSYGDAMLVL
jgi:S-adenosylmethionine:tRNA ribosyltransferase-isomerase